VHLARAQHVQADSRGRCRKPRSKVSDLVSLGPTEAQPSLLHRVVRVRQGAKQPIGDIPEVRPVELKLFSEICCWFIGHIPPLCVIILMTSEL
jgi:hypothetical protein